MFMEKLLVKYKYFNFSTFPTVIGNFQIKELKCALFIYIVTQYFILCLILTVKMVNLKG